MFCLIEPNGRVVAAFRFEYEAMAALRRAMKACWIEFRMI